MIASDLPLTVHDISVEWIAAALSDGGLNNGLGEIAVESVDIEPFGAGTAFLGSLARLHITYAEQQARAPRSLIAKLPTTDEGARQVGSFLRVWFREAMFYAHLADQLPDTVSVPCCYFNAIDDATGHTILLLSDETPAEAGDQVLGATVQQATVAVEALATFQSTWWGVPRNAAVRWVPGIDAPALPGGLQATVTSSLGQFEAKFANALPAESVEINRQFAHRLSDWLSHIGSHPLTIAHADYRLDNLLFHPAGAVTIVDWQTAMYTGGVTDLAFLLGSSLDIELRRTIEQQMLVLYRDKLVENGVDESLLQHVEADYRTSMLWWMAMVGNNLAAVETDDPRSLALFESMLTRLHTAALDLEAASIDF